MVREITRVMEDWMRIRWVNREIEEIAMKKTNWKVILKVIIAVATAIAGVVGGQAMTF